MNIPENSPYFAYLLRLWQSTDESGLPIWRASLESPTTGERQGFPNLQVLFSYLEETTEKFSINHSSSKSPFSVGDQVT